MTIGGRDWIVGCAGCGQICWKVRSDGVDHTRALIRSSSAITHRLPPEIRRQMLGPQQWNDVHLFESRFDHMPRWAPNSSKPQQADETLSIGWRWLPDARKCPATAAARHYLEEKTNEQQVTRSRRDAALFLTHSRRRAVVHYLFSLFFCSAFTDPICVYSGQRFQTGTHGSQQHEKAWIMDDRYIANFPRSPIFWKFWTPVSPLNSCPVHFWVELKAWKVPCCYAVRSISQTFGVDILVDSPRETSLQPVC